MDRKDMVILKKTDRVNGSSYRTNPRPSDSSKRFEREKEFLSLNAPAIKFQKAFYEEF